MMKYNSYKDSEIDWLGEVPSTWQVLRVKDITKKMGSGVTPKGGSEVYVDSGIPLLRSQNVYDDGLRIEDVSFIDEETHQKMKNSQLQPMDILINITGASIGRTCVVPETLPTANINQHIIFIRMKKSLVPYASYYFKSNALKEYINLIQAGSSKEALNMGQTLNTPILLPDEKEQTAIADYLDTKTQAIDRKVNLLEKKIGYYQELRKSLINETVTKGLDKNVKLKDSGIDWIGQIPEHWEVRRLKDLGNIETSSVNKKIEEGEKLIRLVNYVDVYNNPNKEIWNSEDFMTVSANELQIRTKRLRKGDALFTPSSETIEDIGVSSIVMENLDNTLYSYHLIRLRFSCDFDIHFKKYMLNNDMIQYYFSHSATGTTRKILGLNTFYNLQIIFPPSKIEQEKIGEYLKKKTSTIAKIITNIRTQISTLKELRKTLINDVVMGKIKVTQD